jgi:hypothetical protein
MTIDPKSDSFQETFGSSASNFEHITPNKMQRRTLFGLKFFLSTFHMKQKDKKALDCGTEGDPSHSKGDL